MVHRSIDRSNKCASSEHFSRLNIPGLDHLARSRVGDLVRIKYEIGLGHELTTGMLLDWDNTYVRIYVLDQSGEFTTRPVCSIYATRLLEFRIISELSESLENLESQF